MAEYMGAGKRRLPIALAVFLIMIGVWIGISPPKTPRIFLNQRRAVASIQALNLAEQEYATLHPDTGFACNISDLGRNDSEVSRSALVDRVLVSGTSSWYHFDIRCSPSVGRAAAYRITALPVEPGVTGQYALCTDQSREIWYSENGSPSDCLATRKPVDRKYR